MRLRWRSDIWRTKVRSPDIRLATEDDIRHTAPGLLEMIHQLQLLRTKVHRKLLNQDKLSRLASNALQQHKPKSANLVTWQFFPLCRFENAVGRHMHAQSNFETSGSQKTEELGRERTDGKGLSFHQTASSGMRERERGGIGISQGDDDEVEIDIVASQIMKQIETEKNGQLSARASTPLSVALKPLPDSVVLSMTHKSHYKPCPNKHMTKMQWATNFFDYVSCLSFSSLYFIYSLFCLSQAACVKRVLNHVPIKLK